MNNPLSDVKRDDVLKIGGFGWKVFKAEDSVTVYATKKGTKGRKMYRLRLVSHDSNIVAVALINGVGEELKVVAQGQVKK